MIESTNMKIHDIAPVYYVKVTDSNRKAVDLTGATIVFTMKSATDATVKIDRQSVVLADQTTNTGECYYQWVVGDTDVVDEYYVEMEITPADGKKYTLPSNDTISPAIVNINDSLDTV